MIFKSTIYGVIGMITLLIIYFSIVSLISGWQFTINQFFQFWYFIISLAIGFGIQIGLYTYLKNAIQQKNPASKVLTISGITSTASMISCCTHYLTNILPILGTAGFLSLISQYQIELFWLGLAFNLFGIFYISRKVVNLNKL